VNAPAITPRRWEWKETCKRRMPLGIRGLVSQSGALALRIAYSGAGVAPRCLQLPHHQKQSSTANAVNSVLLLLFLGGWNRGDDIAACRENNHKLPHLEAYQRRTVFQENFQRTFNNILDNHTPV
jgi:hypothetical protein